MLLFLENVRYLGHCWYHGAMFQLTVGFLAPACVLARSSWHLQYLLAFLISLQSQLFVDGTQFYHVGFLHLLVLHVCI